MRIDQLIAAPQAHLQRRRPAGQCAEVADAVFGHAEHHVSRAVVGQAQHGRAGGHHHARFGIDGGDHAGGIGHQRRIGGLIALHAGLSVGLLELCLGGAQRDLAALQLGRADEALVTQVLVALEVGSRPIEVALCAGQCRARSVLCQLQVLRIELGQHLARLDRVAQLGLAAGDLAADAKAQSRFGAGPHLGGVLVATTGGVAAHGHRTHGAHGFRSGFLPGAGRHTGGQSNSNRQGGSRHAHGEILGDGARGAMWGRPSN